MLVPPLEGGEPSTLGTVLPCDAPRVSHLLLRSRVTAGADECRVLMLCAGVCWAQVTMSPYIAFDFTGCASFPCVVVTT